MDETAAAAVGETLRRTGLTPADLGAVSETIARSNPPSAVAEHALPQVSLATTAADGKTAAGPDLVVIRELGSGGMGVVHLAEQRSLQREVAVKTARFIDDAAGRALVREGRIMGALEHPNLVPIHSLGVDGAGAPLLVMKRVEGTSWRELLGDDKQSAWPPLLLGHGDKLRANIDILAQVSRALAFAHDRGIIHRDLKPDNVMIGRFGEVYLLDWGVAVRLTERESEPRTIVGTPSYLAPEMAAADPRQVDARTDVFLLGATLYEVLTGRVPHAGATVVAALEAAVRGQPPPIQEGAPADLVALIRSAMALDPTARPASAEAFREGLARYLASRETDLVVEAARAALARADAKLAAEGAASPDGYRALIEARFGLTSAARARPRDPAIRAQLDLAAVKLVERELALRSPGAARLLLAELSQAPAALVRQVELLESQVTSERTAADRLERARRAGDSTTMVRTLTFLVISNAIVWFAWAAVFKPRSWEGGALPVIQTLTLNLGVAASIGVTLAVARRRLFATRGSTRVTLSITFLTLGVMLSDLVNAALGGALDHTIAHWLVVGMAAAAIIAVTELPEFWCLVVIQAACLCTILLRPMTAVWVSTVHHVMAFLIMAWAVRRHARRSRAH